MTESSESATVWVAETGCYADRYVSGVFATAEAAMAAHPSREGQHRGSGSAERPGGWQFDEELRMWSNGLDWNEAVDITEHKVQAVIEC